MNKNLKMLVYGLVTVLVIGGIYYMTTVTQSGSPAVRTEGATAVSQSAATLNGEVNPNGSQASFWYEFGKTSALGTKTGVQLLGAGHTGLSAPEVLNTLDASATYYFRIAAQNEFGISYGAINNFTTTGSATPAPAAGNPPTVQVTLTTDIAQTSGSLNGIVNPRGYPTKFWFEYGKTFSLGNVTVVTSVGSGATDVVVRAALSNLEPGTTYYYRANAQNDWGTVNSAIFSFTTASPSAPVPTGKAPTAETDLAAFVSRTGATLRGFVNPLGTATTYWFEYGNEKLPGDFQLDKQTTPKSAGAGVKNDVVTSILSRLDPNSTYYYRVVAENKYGKSFGAILNFKTQQ